MTILLRFRDLTVPVGETIRRRSTLIDSQGATWWGWIMRQDEKFPEEFILRLSKVIEDEGQQGILLFHTGAGLFYEADLSGISALPGGFRIRSPELDLTPVYMHESVCPVWFELSGIRAMARQPALSIVAMPTLAKPSETDKQLLLRPNVTAQDLRNSGATLWVTKQTAHESL